MHRRRFLHTAAWLSAGATLPGFLGKNADPLIGHGDFRYRVHTDWCKADPAAHPVKNCHEMVFDRQGRILMTTDDTRNNILIFNKDGKVLDAWGHDYPGAHGLSLHDEGGVEMLYIADFERHQVVKTTLSGRVLQTFGWPADAGKYDAEKQFCPTETAIGPRGDVFIADGYGKDFVAHYSPEGHLKNLFGGPDLLRNAHGIALDTRDASNPVLLVTSRAENALKRFSLDGQLLESIALPGAYICRPVVQGKNVYFAVLISRLPWDSGTGFVLILDENNRVVSAPAGSAPRYDNNTLRPLYQTIRVFNHPHDVLADADANLYVAQWNSGGVYPLRLERT